MAQFEDELMELEKLEDFLTKMADKIDATINEKKSCLDKSSQLKFERRDLSNKLFNQQHDKDIYEEKFNQTEVSIEELT